MTLRRWAALAGAGVGLVLTAGVFAWRALPGWLQDRVEAEGSAALGRTVKVERIDLALHPLSATVEGLSVAAADAAASPQLVVKRLHLAVSYRSVWTFTPVIDRLEIDAPRVTLQRTAPGRWDVDDVVQRLQARPAKAPPPQPEPLPEAVLREVHVRDGAFLFIDRPSGRRHAVEALNVALPFLSTRAADSSADVRATLAMRLDAAPVTLEATAQPFASARSGRAALKVEGLALDRAWPWLDELSGLALPWRPQGGTAALTLNVQARQPAGQPWQVVAGGETSVRDLAVVDRQGRELAAWQALSVVLEEARYPEQRVALGTVRLEGLRAQAQRDARGRIDVLEALGSLAAPEATPGAVAKAGPSRTLKGDPAQAAPPAAPASAPSTAAASTAAASAASPWSIKVGRVEIAGARLSWRDAATRPEALLALDPIEFTASDLTWPQTSRLTAQGSARLLAGRTPAGTLSWEGEVTAERATLEVTAQGLSLGAAAPYLKPFLTPSLEGQASARARLSAPLSDLATLRAEQVGLEVRDLRLTPVGTSSPALRWARLSAEGGTVDLATRRVALGSLQLSKPDLTLKRGPKGELDALNWVVAAPSGAASVRPMPVPSRPGPAASSAPEWSARLDALRLEGGRMVWSDAAAPGGQPVELLFQGLSVGARGLAWPLPVTPVPVELAVQMPDPQEPAQPPGRLSVNGSVGLKPLSAQARVRVERWPAEAFVAYAGDALPVRLRTADLGVDGEVRLRWTDGGLALQTATDVVVANLRLEAPAPAGAAAGDELATWNALSLKPLKVELSPGARPRVEVGEARLSDFFARLQITEDGRLNFQSPTDDSARPAPEQAKAPAPGTPPPATRPAEGPTPPIATAAAESGPRWPLDLVVGSTVLANGRVDFNDRFIRPNYSADLSELNGTLGRFESGSTAMAPLEIRGRAARTALLEIRGAVNPAITPVALDLSARATDLELAPLSPYSGKYAGYLIERGKLSVDLAYRIEPDGKLEAKNQVILNQLTFGDKVDSPSATSLPVKFAVALLSDRNGVIDINLPISGSINDPQFSLFGLVLKVIGNLIVKAVTAPFAWLAGGGGAEQSQVEFLPGTAQVAPASQAVLDRVAKALAERPALRMTVVGAADPVLEKDAMQAAALESRLAEAARRDAARASTAVAPSPAAVPSTSVGGAPGSPTVEAGAAPAPAPGSPQRAALLKRLYTDAPLPDKPRNMLGLLRDLPPPEMEARLRTAVVVSTDTGRALALQRGLAVRDALIARGLPAERLFLGAPKLRAAGEDEAAWTPRVELSLEGR